MALVFDPDKNDANIAKHGLSLAEAGDFDFSRAVIVEDVRMAYGERRWLAFSRMQGRGRCLVFCIVDAQTIRAISHRHARDKELRRHGL